MPPISQQHLAGGQARPVTSVHVLHRAPRGRLVTCQSVASQKSPVNEPSAQQHAPAQPEQHPTPSKGFGPSKPAKPSGLKKQDLKDFEQAPRTSPAPGGRIDRVEVQDWGTGNQADWAELKVKTVETMYGESAQVAGQPATVVTTQNASSTAGKLRNQVRDSLYERLCHEMAAAEKRGALALAGPPPPPLKSWSFTPTRYMQYLADCLVVHKALESALAASIQSSSTSQAPGLLQALINLHATGLSRSEAIHVDLRRLCKHHAAQAPTASTAANTHAGQLQRLARDISAWANQTPTGIQTDKVQVEIKVTGEAAAATVMAQAFAVYALHAAGGMRFGAAAAEKLSLLQLDAVHFYRTYPESVQEPLETLHAALDVAGKALTVEQHHTVLEAVPDAARSASMLLMALAHTD